MHIGYISKNELRLFSVLLLPEVVSAIEQGRPVTALGISVDRIACGAVAGYIDDNIFKITSLFISEGYRKKGYARSLLLELRLLLKMYSEVTAMEIGFTLLTKDHESLLPFLQKTGFMEQDGRGRAIYQLSLERLTSSPLFQQIPETITSNILPFSRLPEEIIYLIEKKSRDMDIPVPAASLTDPSIYQELSLAYVSKGKVSGFIIFDSSLAGKLTLSCLWVDPLASQAMPLLLRYAFQKIQKDYPAEDSLFLQTINTASTNLLLKLFPDCKPLSYNFYYYFPYISDWRL